MPLLSNYIAKDVLNYINKTGYNILKGDYKPIHTISEEIILSLSPQIKTKIIKVLKEAINSNISDLYGAITYNKIHGEVGHDNDYWAYNSFYKNKYRVTAEAIAEMFESFGNTERIKAMREFLPLAWNYFNKRLEEVF